ncbi:MAG: ABC-2 transporter permease [Candidatus Izemoplasmatales bacterium]
MKNLLYKEFKLSIHKAFLFAPIIFGALLLIPQWVYLIALMYLFWVTVPNIYSTYNSQNDRTFCMLMPIKKEDYVKTKILSLMIIELLHIIFAVIFALIHNQLYEIPNFMLDLNFALFGVGFMMYGIFNLIFYPIYFKTAYYFGKAAIFANIGAIIFAFAVEASILIFPDFQNLMEGSRSIDFTFQLIIFIGGIALFIGFNYLAYLISKSKFSSIDL